MARPKYPSDKQDQFMLRLPDGMRDRIRAAAEVNNRSMNAEIILRLEAFEAEAKSSRLKDFFNEGRRRQNTKLSRENAALKARLERFYAEGGPDYYLKTQPNVPSEVIEKMISDRVQAVVDEKLGSYRSKLEHLEATVAEQAGARVRTDLDKASE